MTLRLAKDEQPLPGYRLVRRLGRGGFGEAWEAQAPGGFPVALKFIPAEGGKAQKELSALNGLRRIRHANLLDVQFATTVEDVLVLGSPLCDESLLNRLVKCLKEQFPDVPRSELFQHLRESDQTGGIPVEELLGYLREAAAALDYLHAQQVQHRDVKPHNLFLVGGSVRVADFGLAKALEQVSASHSGQMTPEYAAPEMCQDRIHRHSDQYSLAVTYYQLRTGRLPFEADSRLAVLWARMQGEPDLSKVSGAERPVLARALAPEPDARWPSCREFCRQLETALVAGSAAGANCQDRGHEQPRPDWESGRATSASRSDLAEPERTVAVNAFADNPDTGRPEWGTPDPSIDRRAEASTQSPADTNNDSQADTLKPKQPSRCGPPRSRSGAKRTVLAAVLTVAAAASFYVVTNEGTVKIELSDPNAAVVVRVDDRTIEVQNLDEPLRLRVGEHKLTVTGPRFRSVGESFIVLRGGETVLHAALVPKDEAASAESRPPAAGVAKPPKASHAVVKKLKEKAPLAIAAPKKTALPVLGGVPLDVPGPQRVAPEVFAGTRAGQESANALGMKLCWCPPGRFAMGRSKDDPYRRDDEHQVEVEITTGFWLSKHEVTQSQWEQVTGTTFDEQMEKTDRPMDFGQGARYPMYYVNWDEAEQFCQKLTVRERTAGRLPAGWEYRLPTEAQWEYACRAGTTTATAFGDQLTSKQASIYDVDSARRLTAMEVGSYAGNAWGLCDMHGNVWEWCRDWYTDKLPGGKNPEAVAKATKRVIRGGCWSDSSAGCGSAIREGCAPDMRSIVGFRVAAVRVER